MRPIQAKTATPCLAAALLFGTSTLVSAQQLGWTGYVAQTFDITDNANLRPNSPGLTNTSTTTLGLNWLRQTEATSFALDAAADLYISRQPNGTTETEIGYPSIGLSYRDSTTTRSIVIGASYDVTPASPTNDVIFDDFDGDGILDPGEVTVFYSDEIQYRTRVFARYSRNLNSTNSIFLRGSASMITFSETNDQFVPSNEQGLELGWNTELSPDLTAGISLSGDWFQNEADFPAEANTTTLSGNFGFEANNSVVYGGSLGIARVVEERNSNVETDVGLTGDLSVVYALPASSFEAVLDFGFNPTTDGELRQTVALLTEYNRTINNDSSISVQFDLIADRAIGSAAGTGNRRLIFAPVYNYALTSDVDAYFGYRFEREFESGGGTSNGVFAGVSKSFAF
jgi:hypothetical protein